MTKRDPGLSQHVFLRGHRGELSRYDSMETKISAIQESAKKEHDEILAEISKLELRRKSQEILDTSVVDKDDDDDRFREVLEKMIETRYKDRLEALSNQVEYERKQNKQLKKQMERDRDASLMRERNLLANTADLRQRLEESRAREDTCEIVRRKSAEDLQLWEIDIHNLRSLNEKMLEENTTLQEINEKQKHQCEEVTEELNDQAVRWCEEVVTCKDELENTVKEVHKLNILYTVEKTECTNARAEWDETKAALNSEQTALRSALAAAEESASTQIAAALHWNEEALLLKTDNSELTDAMASLREEATVLSNSLAQMRSEYSEARHKCDEARHERDTAEVERQLAFSTSAEATKVLEHLRESLQSREHNQLWTERRRIAEREKYSTELARAREELTTAAQARERLTEQANERVARARRDQKDREAKLKAAHDEELASAQITLNATSRELDQTHRELKSTSEDLARVGDELLQTQSELVQVQRQSAVNTENTQVSTSRSSSVSVEHRRPSLLKNTLSSKDPVTRVLTIPTPSAPSPRKATLEMRPVGTTATIDASGVNKTFKPAVRRRNTAAPPPTSSLLKNVTHMVSKPAQPYFSSSVPHSAGLRHLLRTPLCVTRNVSESPRGKFGFPTESTGMVNVVRLPLRGGSIKRAQTSSLKLAAKQVNVNYTLSMKG
eukprot:GEMP01012630.1.p1 GENE.GEMP01012630.1~~GEMP01012630.1.p1  ORF type:complete len:674 (+),score=180.49 GEMP01012630.1:146-2167(+)